MDNSSGLKISRDLFVWITLPFQFDQFFYEIYPTPYFPTIPISAFLINQRVGIRKPTVQKPDAFENRMSLKTGHICVQFSHARPFEN